MYLTGCKTLPSTLSFEERSVQDQRSDVYVSACPEKFDGAAAPPPPVRMIAEALAKKE